jgi:hypothetical protein
MRRAQRMFVAVRRCADDGLEHFDTTTMAYDAGDARKAAEDSDSRFPESAQRFPLARVVEISVREVRTCHAPSVAAQEPAA